MHSAAEEILRAYEAVAGEVVGRKHKRRLIVEMQRWLLMQIPANGIGPIMGVRREAVQILDSAVRSCAKRQA